MSNDCHESITFAANEALRDRLELELPRMTRDERALVDDAPFPVPSDQRDLAAVTLALGNRDVDLHGNAPDDLDQLAEVHGTPSNQDEHCLRRAEDDEPNGSERALARCRDYIESRVEAALVGLDESGQVDFDRRTDVDVFVDIRGVVEAPLPTFYLEMGRALHALQDAFSHHYRTDDHEQVTVVLNYIDTVNNDSYDESRDGPPHSSPMDECENLDDYRQQRLETAARASMELMLATLEPGDLEMKNTRVAAVLDRYLAIAPGCTAENDWCNASEAAYKEESGCLCRASGGRAPPGAIGLLALGIVGVWRARRRSRPTLHRAAHRRAALSALLVFTWLAGAARASAQEALPGGDQPRATLTSTDFTPDSPSKPEPFPFGVYVAGAGAVQNTALAASLGFRYRINALWLVGVDVEYNPFIVQRSGELRSGVGNLYATGIKRWPMRFERANLRTSIHVGASRMLFDLYGAPEGTTGPYFGFNLLGIDIELTRSLYLVIDPADIAIPIPQTSGVPFVYPQYRFTLGLQLGA